MAFRNSLLFTGLGIMTTLATHECLAQAVSNKADALAALDEPTTDLNRFDRVAALARSLGVSDARITLSRFSQMLFSADVEGAKRLYSEAEKALTAIAPSEASGNASEVRGILPQVKKILESPDTNRVRVLFEKSRKGIEAKTILLDLRAIDSAVDQCAIEQGLKVGAPVPAREWIKKIRPGSRLRETGADIFGVSYGDQVVDKAPKPNPASLEKVAAHIPANYFDLTTGGNAK